MHCYQEITIYLPMLLKKSMCSILKLYLTEGEEIKCTTHTDNTTLNSIIIAESDFFTVYLHLTESTIYQITL